MASPFQQQALVRKFVYIGVILALAFGTYLLREARPSTLVPSGGIRAPSRDLGCARRKSGDVELDRDRWCA